MSDVAIRVENLGKQYRIGRAQQRHDSLRDALVASLQAPFSRMRRNADTEAMEREDTIWALKDVSFDVKHGEVVGIIGRNGAGKSTLLKILSRITEPTTGRAVVNGRVGSLLEVGTGFHPELTGRENIYLNGAMLGMRRKEIDRKFDEIVAFSEIEKFLDTPVKRYSSGMYVRLAFAVAAHLEPEILIVDEVLAVGDVAFQKKCLGKMGDVAKQGRTVLFVSHNMQAVRKLCSDCMMLVDGCIETSGPTEVVLNRYLAKVQEGARGEALLPRAPEDAPGSGIWLRFFDQKRNISSQFLLGEAWDIELRFVMHRPTSHVIAAVGLVTIEGIAIITYWSKPKDLDAGEYSVTFECRVPLKACNLQFAVGLSSNDRTFYYVPEAGNVMINPIAESEQPFRASGAGLLLGDFPTSAKEIRLVRIR